MIKVLAFDTFGTVADWYTGVSTALAETFPDLDSSRLALDWRRTYVPGLLEVESGERPWTLLDDLHRESLQRLLADSYGVTATAAQLDAAVHAWHVLPGWPDSSDGLRRLKTRFTIGALSNGNVALLTEMAKNADFPWDFVGGADLWRHYKPAAEVYLGVADLMQVRPEEVLMVATHVSDLAAARSFGLQTAYIERPREWGPEPKPAERDPLDLFHVSGIDQLADALGC
ncbi:MAG: haloacid dehalogenase type II [Gordonia sp. (in: high G+C Gram-positive bacteria)]|nr:haloacid dehalogenase type II [Gordonia sp. (in: high G+C Gram-positive bacteria)]